MRRFLFRLCLSLGISHPDHLNLTWKQVQEWLAFAELEPFGDYRADLRAGIIASSAVNLWGGKSKPLDFMPVIRDLQNKERVNNQQPQSAEDIEAFFMKLASGGKSKGKEKKAKGKKRRT